MRTATKGRDVVVLVGGSEGFVADPTLVIGPDDSVSMLVAVEAGARGYATDDQPVADILDAVRVIATGGASVPAHMLGALLGHVVRRRRVREQNERLLTELTPREREILAGAARGLGKNELATALFISPETARTHLHNVQRKLGVTSRAELVGFAAESGFDTSRIIDDV